MLESELDEKRKEVSLLQKELKSVNEFRKHKAKITEEIKEMKNTIEQQRLENDKTKQRLEHEFFVEQMKMEREVKKSNFLSNSRFFGSTNFKNFFRLVRKSRSMQKKLKRRQSPVLTKRLEKFFETTFRCPK